MNKLLCLILISLMPYTSFSRSEVVAWLNQNAYPISSDTPENESENLSFLNSLATKSIIGLGEACHGNKDFANIQFQFIRHLVINHNFKVIILENDYFVAEQINRFITSDMEFDHLNGMKMLKVSAEYYLLYRWLKDYNKNKTSDQKVKVYGMDTWGQIPLNRIRALFRDENIMNVQSFNTIFQEIEDILKRDSGNQRGKLLAELSRKCTELKGILRRNALEELWYVDLIYQTGSADFYRKKSSASVWQPKRESYMFNNIQHILKIEKSAKSIIIAHNGHLNNRDLWLGKDLKELYGNQYYIIGSAFESGSTYGFNPQKEYVVNILPDSPPSSIGKLMGKCKHKIFFFHFEQAKSHSVMNSYLKARNTYLFSGYNAKFEKDRTVLARDYDAFLFIRKINAADIW